MRGNTFGLFTIAKALRNPLIAGILTGLTLLLIGAYTTYLAYDVAKKNQQREMFNLMNAVEQNIDQALSHSQSAALTIALTINHKGQPENFDSVAAQVIGSNPYINALELVPDGVIKYIYPLAGNEDALDYNILADPSRKKEALVAKENREMYFAGPLELKQGGTAIIGRIPVFIHHKFWGFSAVIIPLESLLQNIGIESGKMGGYIFQLAKVNPNTNQEEYFLPTGSEWVSDATESMRFPEGNWTVYMKKTGEHTLSSLTSVLMLGFLSIILSVLGGFFVQRLVIEPFRLHEKLQQHSRALVESESKFRTFFEQAAVGVIHIEIPSGKYLSANNKYCQMLGYEESELQDLTILDVTHPDDIEETQRNLTLILDGEIREYSIDKRYYQKNRKMLWVNVTVSTLRQPDEKPTSCISIVEDITEKKNFQQLLLESSIQAQEKEKNRIASELHDGIVQELVACGIQSESLTNQLGDNQATNDKLKQLTQLIKKITNDTRSLSHNLLSADMNQMSLSELISRLEHQLKSLSDIDLQMETHLESEEYISEEVKTNLYRAVQELTTNIIKHSKATFAKITIEQIGNEIYVTIRDNGIGFKHKVSAEIGIGSYNVKTRINKIGGSIQYYNPKSGGLEVSFSVPMS